MKRFLLSIALIAALVFTVNAQEPEKKAFILTGGLSQITGFGGFEWHVNNLSVDLGFGSITAPLSGEQTITTGGGITFYSAPHDQSSMYLALGYTGNGAYYDYWSSSGQSYTKFEDTFTAMIGYRLAGTGIFSLKGGVGYSWATDVKGFSYELKLGIKIFQNPKP
jgi:hypothetical protein